jgi:hypothetical protein
VGAIEGELTFRTSRRWIICRLVNLHDRCVDAWISFEPLCMSWVQSLDRRLVSGSKVGEKIAFTPSI